MLKNREQKTGTKQDQSTSAPKAGVDMNHLSSKCKLWLLGYINKVTDLLTAYWGSGSSQLLKRWPCWILTTDLCVVTIITVPCYSLRIRGFQKWSWKRTPAFTVYCFWDFSLTFQWFLFLDGGGKHT